jgi:hypothetical protein
MACFTLLDVRLLNAINSATQCNGTLPPSAITKGYAKSHPRRRRAVRRLRFGQDNVRLDLGGSKVRFAEQTSQNTDPRFQLNERITLTVIAQ